MKKYTLLILVAAAAMGCNSTKVPGVMESKNFFFNTKIAELAAQGSTVSTNGTVTNLTLAVKGFTSEANENLKVIGDMVVKAVAAYASGGTSMLLPTAQPVMLMAPVSFPTGVSAPTSGQSQVLYLVPMGRAAPAQYVYPSTPPPQNQAQPQQP